MMTLQSHYLTLTVSFQSQLCSLCCPEGTTATLLYPDSFLPVTAVQSVLPWRNSRHTTLPWHCPSSPSCAVCAAMKKRQPHYLTLTVSSQSQLCSLCCPEETPDTLLYPDSFLPVTAVQSVLPWRNSSHTTLPWQFLSSHSCAVCAALKKLQPH